jgi:amino acid permease
MNETKNETGALGEKQGNDGSPYVDPENGETVATGNILHRDLQGRHMQMIAM